MCIHTSWGFPEKSPLTAEMQCQHVMLMYPCLGQTWNSKLHRVVSPSDTKLLCRRSMQLSTINQRHDSLITSKFKMFWENLYISNIVISIVFLYSWEAQNRKGFKLELTMKRSKVVAIIIWYFHCNWSEKQQLLCFFVWLIQLLVNRFVLSQTNRLTD